MLEAFRSFSSGKRKMFLQVMEKVGKCPWWLKEVSLSLDWKYSDLWHRPVAPDSSGFMKLSGNEVLVPQIGPCQHSVCHLTSKTPTELPENILWSGVNLLPPWLYPVKDHLTTTRPMRAALGQPQKGRYYKSTQLRIQNLCLKKLRDLYSFLGSVQR